MKNLIYPLLISLILFSCNSEKINETYLNPNLPAKKRVELLLKEMTLEEKIGQMCMYVGEASNNSVNNEDEKVQYTIGIGERAELIKRGEIGSFLKVPTYKETNYLQELAEKSRLKIPLLIATDAIHGHGMYQDNSTIYPTPIGIAASFDTSVAYRIAKYTAHEMRATGYHWTFSPNIEVVRDPRWGRTGESFGEDPVLISAMGIAMIKGYQGANFTSPGNVLACAKHFVAGGIAYNGLNGAPADISERTLNEVFFPPFINAVNENVYTIMPAHNEINGIPCHAHERYLTDLIRNKWNFNGLYVSDWMDLERLVTAHNIATTQKEAYKIAVLAGLDIHMHGPGFFTNVKELVEEGSIPIDRINHAVGKILYAKFQLGLFENRYIDSLKVTKVLLKKEHRDLALETAKKSIVLLKNNDKTLPLNKKTKSIFITGPNANSPSILGDWARIQPNNNITTVLDGIKSIVSPQTKIDYLPCKRYDSISNDILSQAKTRAGLADVAIVVVGENSIRFDNNKTSGENLDRATLEFAGEQLKLVKSIESSGTPVVVVFINGGPIASEWTVNNVDAILEAWEPGMYGGQAIAEVIFGDYNPGGKLPITIPRSVGHIQSFYNFKPSVFHRGKFYLTSKEPLYTFGFGLSYTEFEYKNLKLPEQMGTKDDLTFSLTIKNIGEMVGDEVILIYLNDKISSVTTPVKKLVNFQRITLQPNEEQELSFTIKNNHFKLFDKDMNYIIESGEFEIIIGNNIMTSTVLVE